MDEGFEHFIDRRFFLDFWRFSFCDGRGLDERGLNL